MPGDKISIRLIAQQRFVEQLGYQIVQEEEELCPESSTVSAFPIQWHDNFSRELPSHSDVCQARVHGRCRVLPAWRIETELNERQKLVERLFLRWPAGKTAGEVIGAVLKGQAPVQRFDGGNQNAWSLPLGALKPSEVVVAPKGNSSTNAPVTAKGRSHASPSGKSPNPLPKKTPG